MYFLKTSRGVQIIGSSPEMLLRVSKGYLETYPIAGTRPVVTEPETNEKLMRELVNDKKEIAEHTMLVDLARNDVGKVSKYGSVNVKDLMAVKRFSHVQHMVTHVSGSLRNSFDYFDAFKALFPSWDGIGCTENTGNGNYKRIGAYEKRSLCRRARVFFFERLVRFCDYSAVTFYPRK